MNKWMNNPQFLAQAAHSGWACTFVVTAAFFGGWMAALVIAALFVVYAAVKEFWYDHNFELPKQTDKDDWEDFAGYMGGLVLGLLLVFIKYKI